MSQSQHEISHRRSTATTACCRTEKNGFEATHTLELPEGNHTTDQALIKLSISDQSVLVTKDSDFVQSFLLKREPWKLLLVSTSNISNDDFMKLFELNLDQIAHSLTTFDFVELNRTNLICHL